MHSDYDDIEGVRRGVDQGGHRKIIGDMWDELGALQFEFLRTHGLEPSAKLLDVGCGSLRGGVRFVRYLDAGRYFGLDSNESLLDAGYERELWPLGLAHKLPRDQLVCNSNFDFDEFPGDFDFALAQSLFSHLPLNHLRLCLARLAPKMKPGGRFFVTFFQMPDEHAIGRPLRHEIGGVTTYDWRDPYHYYVRDLAYAARDLPWRLNVVGRWDHPRDQQMAEFIREG